MNELSKEYFFCYTKSMSLFLKENGINYLFKAISVKNNQVFTLYKKSDELQEALNKFNQK